MNFGEAIELVKEGGLIQRTGWNGNGLFVFQQIPAEISLTIVPNMQSLPQAVKDEFERRYNVTVDDGIEFEGEEVFNSIRYDNQLALVQTDNTIQGWNPSTADALAEDWVEYTPYALNDLYSSEKPLESIIIYDPGHIMSRPYIEKDGKKN